MGVTYLNRRSKGPGLEYTLFSLCDLGQVTKALQVLFLLQHSMNLTKQKREELQGD